MRVKNLARKQDRQIMKVMMAISAVQIVAAFAAVFLAVGGKFNGEKTRHVLHGQLRQTP